MDRYYFHHRSDTDYIFDEEGSVHNRLTDALREGCKCAREIMRSQISGGRLNLGNRIEIYGEAGFLIATIVFSEVATGRANHS